MSLVLLLTPRQTTAVMMTGLDVVAGLVLPDAALEDGTTFADADAARAALGHPHPAPGRGQFVDFLVLPEHLPPVDVTDGRLAPTRVPSGTSYHRLEADGTRHLITYYDTPAFGWRNARGPVRPAADVGLRARWRGLDLVAALEDGIDGVHLVALSDPDQEPPEGFTWTKAGVSRRTVPTSECQLYEREVAATLEGVRGRVVDRDASHATLLLPEPTSSTTAVAAGWHDARVPLERLDDVTVAEQRVIV